MVPKSKNPPKSPSSKASLSRPQPCSVPLEETFDAPENPLLAAMMPPKGKPSPEIPSKDSKKSDYLGHRTRLRQRFLDSKGIGLLDYELLELILFYTNPRQDTKPTAKALMARFGSLPRILQASPAELSDVKGISQNASVLLAAIQTIAERSSRIEVVGQPILSSWAKLLQYLQMTMAREKVEQFRVVFLDVQNTIIGDEVLQTGTIDQAHIYPREIIKRALTLGASAMVLVHNHPSGDPLPSHEDILMTKQIVRAASSVGVTVHDHVIIAEKGHASFRHLGIL